MSERHDDAAGPGRQEPNDNDWQAAWVFDAGLNVPPLRRVKKMRSNAQTWLYHGENLIDFRGQTVTLYFTAINDGAGDRRTWWYVDDVVLTVCGSTQVAVVPAQPQRGTEERQRRITPCGGFSR